MPHRYQIWIVVGILGLVLYICGVVAMFVLPPMIGVPVGILLVLVGGILIIVLFGLRYPPHEGTETVGIFEKLRRLSEEKRQRRKERQDVLREALFAYDQATRLYGKIVDRHYDDGDLPDDLMSEAGIVQNLLIALNDLIARVWFLEEKP